MKVEAKAFGRKGCTSEKVGKLVFEAQNEVDAVQLAAIFEQFHEGKGRLHQLRAEALQRYCRKHNVTIRMQ